MILRNLGVHFAVLVVAGALAARGWLAEDKPDGDVSVEVWGGSKERVERIEYTAKDRSVLLVAESDAQGRYFVAEAQSEAQPEAEGADPHADPHGEHAAGEAAEANAAAEPPGAAAEPNAPKARKTQRFVAVTDAGELAASLAPLKGMRRLGQIEAGRYADFGFDEANLARLKVVIGGQTEELLFGGKTPGGGDQYVRRVNGDEAFVIDGQVARDLQSAESRLLERNLHAWESDSAARVKISAAEAVRELVRSADKQSFWTDPQRPGDKDETASNWMTQLERLRLTQYVEKPATEPQAVFRIEFFSEAGKSLGHLELGSVAGSADKPLYLARSEHTRWWGEVIQSTAEQLVQDLSGLLSQ